MSFEQGLSGLNATSKQLDIIGNNIANANTYGAKASRAEFADVYANAVGGGTQIGVGVALSSVTQQFSVGNITASSNPLDLAIGGSGFFQLDTGHGTVYSRDGEFQIDKSGNIVNSRGQRLLGYAAAADGTIIPSTTQALQLPTAGAAPAPTSNTTLELNLDSRGAVTAKGATPPIAFADPSTYNNATSVMSYDKKGQPVALTYYFQKTAADTWDVYAAANGRSVVDSVGDGTGTPLPVLSPLTFSADGGSVLTPAAPTVINVPAVALSGGGLSEPLVGMSLELRSSTQYGSNFTVTNLVQDGYPPGELTGVSLDKSGVITAQYSNGKVKAAGQVQLANFRNPQGMAPTGGNAWRSTVNSGDPILGVPGSGALGDVQSGALEESNVDMTNELVSMITTQRAYQANAQTIKTEDQVVQTLLNLR